MKAAINIYENCTAIGDPVSSPKDIKRQIIKCAAWASSPRQKLMLVPRSEVIEQAKKLRVLDKHAFIEYPLEDSSESSKSESENGS